MSHIVLAAPPPRPRARSGDAAELAIRAPIDSGKFLSRQKHIRALLGSEITQRRPHRDEIRCATRTRLLRSTNVSKYRYKR
jgi:hypothetical protein